MAELRPELRICQSGHGRAIKDSIIITTTEALRGKLEKNILKIEKILSLSMNKAVFKVP